ncbi:AN1-like Zinc finger-containing protein, putative [Eimeria maxima]|uniref:AN1-like Zinc finger-containing protein, putative n=1 Tax=Eimeria maxima TaxID=5804 RepID=U6M122_EIMMA|nr:AN1-like Zinc finger-containing protein, putative [Eimeria maxima]CDJ56124.1 AN1-like Zinc finger-containing protein, putative [Eimeria maxima]
MAVLSDKGLTCSNSLCRQRDFLPFTCNKCGKVFCLEHYLPDGHSCPRKNAGDRRVYVCQDCLEVISLRLTPISSIKCPNCQVDVCIKHRLKEDHNCEVLLSTRGERKRNSLFKKLSSSASKGMKWHSESTKNSGAERRHVLDHVMPH